MKRNIIIILGFIIIGFVIYAYMFSSIPRNKDVTPETSIEAATSNLAVPEFTFQSIDGKTQNILSFKGKLILIHFWASWCAPCVVELPSLVRLAADYPDEIAILAFSSDTSPEAMKRFLQKEDIKLHGSNIIWSWDGNKAITYDLFQTMVLPETIILNRDLVMVKKYVGDTKWDSAEIRHELDGFSGGAMRKQP